ncbi:TPA: hypothetical protein TUK08_000248 [Streptococcus equi subsp. zooepidemicus]|nr:hypothetical protein [Streptococcus equi subsp. zooepidemicus]HEL0295749.1 hypothetical protein [Streptococcus equi subsp. zooepidemicus]
MKIEVLYKNYCYEEFDSTAHVSPNPYPQGINVLTDWILHLDKIEEQGIVLVEHWYDTKKTNGETTIDGIKITVARRSLGCAILLVSSQEVDNIVWLKKDGKKILWREGDDLINGERFFAMEQLCYSDSSIASVNKRALAIFDYLLKAHPEQSSEQIAKSMGYTMEAIERIQNAEMAQTIEELDDEDNTETETNYDFS